MKRAALGVLLAGVCVLLIGATPFQRALPGYKFEFPRDHGAHGNFRTEWWYFTGNLADESGREFGYQVTFYRYRVAQPGSEIEGRSQLVAGEVYAAHFAISDVAARVHENWERTGRAGFAQADAAPDKLDVSVDDWTATMKAEGTIHLSAHEGGNSSIAFDLAPEKPFVIHGHDGVHQKAGEAGQASHYISFTRLRTTGKLRWRGHDFAINGLTWMDHEFSSDALSPDETGWDWFALQLDHGDDIMVYQLRRADGSVVPASSGTLVHPDGTTEEISSSDFTIRAEDSWTSPHTGIKRPMNWTLTLPSRDGELHVTAAFPDQEMTTEHSVGTTYWEGAVRVEGQLGGRKTAGRGYVELVGYGKAFGLMSAESLKQ